MPVLTQDPNADPVMCDVHNGRMLTDGTLERGCGRPATFVSDGSEPDTHVMRVAANDPEDPQRGVLKKLTRPALPNLNTCERHIPWIHSEDAVTFAGTKTYKDRVKRLNAAAAAGKK